MNYKQVSQLMTFMSGARITEKHHNGAGCCLGLSKQMGLQPPLKRVQWQAAVMQCWWQTVPHCGPMQGEVALAHGHLHSWEVDTSSQCRLQSRTSLKFLHWHAEFLQIWRCDTVHARERRSPGTGTGPPLRSNIALVWSRNTLDQTQSVSSIHARYVA